MVREPVFDYLLLKTASRCNLACTYCYWFRDESVYEKPKVLTAEAEAALLERLESHVLEHRLEGFSILFHGGEPLLLGKQRFLGLLDGLAGVEQRTACSLRLAITTNGVLVDDEWASIFRTFRISPTLSIDGPAAVHDRARITHGGRGSHAKVVEALATLRRHAIEPGVLAVCDPLTSPDTIVSHLAEELDLRHFDILVPDATHEDDPVSIAPYYARLFDLWFDRYGPENVDVRYVRSLLTSVLGGEAHIESIGYGPIQTVAMLTDGALEPLDVLRIAGKGTTATERSIFTHTFQDVLDDRRWREAYDSALNLPDVCQQCEYAEACGGGFLPHRFSRRNGYDNPSVYCDDIKTIFAHIWERVSPQVEVVGDGRRAALSDV